MEQIYYTQCPLGYGLGASNGYQVKRVTRGYPVASDFRHLGLRAFAAGSRTLAPPALRYLRDGDAFEIAWLTPRDREFETERGRWGRPGGHFAHAIRLSKAEFEAIGEWPAGLYDASAWTRSDPQPSRGFEPPPLAIGPEVMTTRPTFAEVSRIAAEIDPEFLARSLSAAAEAAETSRSLFLIGDPEAVARLISTITFAFPEPMRADLTFSTYHDRPEELPGFRLQGTTPTARPNRGLLTTLGTVADLDARSFEPPREVPPWARTLARWLSDGRPESERLWLAARRRSEIASPPEGESRWSAEWIGRLIRVGEVIEAAGRGEPVSGEELAALADWSGRARLSEEFSAARPAAWWADRPEMAGDPSARKALLHQIRWPGAWVVSGPEDWGAVVGAFFRGGDSRSLREAISAARRGASVPTLSAFLHEFLATTSLAAAEESLEWLNRAIELPPGVLPAIEARIGARAVVERGDPAPLLAALGRSATTGPEFSAALQAAAQDAGVDTIPRLADVLADVLDDLPDASAPEIRGAAERWALVRAEAREWLGPSFRSLLAIQDAEKDWTALRDRTPTQLLPSLARTFLEIAVGPEMPDEPFLWGIEQLLLTIDPAIRPRHPSWAEAYLKRRPSNLGLLQCLYSPEKKVKDLSSWIKEARRRGEVSQPEEVRLDQLREFVKALQTADARQVLSLDLPSTPPNERGAILRMMMDHLAGTGPQSVSTCLDACRRAWPGGFEPGVEGLAPLAGPIAAHLARQKTAPEQILSQLRPILDELQLTFGPDEGFEPHGFAAEILASLNRMGTEKDAWERRAVVLCDDRAWKALAADIGRDLAVLDLARARESFQTWDATLDKRGRANRFYELALNACGRSVLAEIVVEKISILRKERPFPRWWTARNASGSLRDIREAFALQAPFAKWKAGRRDELRKWMEMPEIPIGYDLTPVDGRADPDLPVQWPQTGLSDRAIARWQSLHEFDALLSDAKSPDPAALWARVGRWHWNEPALGFSSDADLVDFVAKVVTVLESRGADDPQDFLVWLQTSQKPALRRLSEWLAGLGLIDLVAVSEAWWEIPRTGKAWSFSPVLSELRRNP